MNNEQKQIHKQDGELIFEILEKAGMDIVDVGCYTNGS